MSSPLDQTQHLLTAGHFLLDDSHHTDWSIFLLSNGTVGAIFGEGVLDIAGFGVDRGGDAEQIDDLLVVDLDEGYFDHAVHWLLSLLNLLEHCGDYSGDDSCFFLDVYVAGASAHCVGLAASSLPIGQDRGIVPIETGHHQIFDAVLIDLLLGDCFGEDLVEVEGPLLADDDTIGHGVLDTGILVGDALSIYHRSDSNGDLDSGFGGALGQGQLFVHGAIIYLTLPPYLICKPANVVAYNQCIPG